jgi:Fur family transcriptional regulator, ferric uptake regulator
MKVTSRELNEHGLKATSQRLLILDVIRHSSAHVDADDVFSVVHKKQPRISLSTVYRTLQKFKESGIIEEYHFGEEHHHYEIKPSTEHYHLVCLQCGAVSEFEFPLINTLKKTVPDIGNFKITGSEVTLTGYCKACADKKNQSSGVEKGRQSVSR